MTIYMLNKVASLRTRKLIWPKSTDIIKDAHQAHSQKVKREADGVFLYLSTSRMQIIKDWKEVAAVWLHVCMVLIMASDNRLTRQVIKVQKRL